MDVGVLQIFRHKQPIAAATIAVAALAWLGACAPVAGPRDAGPVGTAASGTEAASSNAAKGPHGLARDIVVGGDLGYHVTLKMTPPAQVCDADAFVDGVRTGYITTWNGLVAASGGVPGNGALRRPVFDPAPVAPAEERYRLQWKGGPEPANACAAYAYQIGKVMGTRQAYIDARGAS
ncbi:hypothetical protein [Mycetohabitans sp. B46]|uniref:hypothetical protein n=1 Tax=Mycetohabitans sp. B46 TaxID=2772536 RepID=UPI00307E3E8A